MSSQVRRAPRASSTTTSDRAGEPASTALNALGDPRALPISYGEGVAPKILANQAAHQLKLRGAISPGGNRGLYLSHLHELAEESGALLTFYSRGEHAEPWVARTCWWGDSVVEVITPVPTSVSQYFTGLHEFGHVFGPASGGTAWDRVATLEDVNGELMAYVWALERARVPISVRLRNAAYRSVLYEAWRIGLAPVDLGDVRRQVADALFEEPA